jgi:hypothetical protein
MLKMRKRAIRVGIEPIYGIPVPIGDCIAIPVSEVDSSPYEGDRIERNRISSTFGAQDEVNAAPHVTLTATIPIAGSGVLGTPSAIGLVLRALGLRELITAGVDVRYMPATDNHESLTVYFVEDGQVQCIPGCKGTMDQSLTAKQFPNISISMTGLYKKVVSASSVPIVEIVNFANEVPVNKDNTSMFNVHGHECPGQSFAFTLGNEVTYRNLAGSEGVEITDRVCTGTIEIQAPSISSKDYFAAIESHEITTQGMFSVEHGKVAGNIVRFEAPKTQLSALSRTDSTGIVHYSLSARFKENTVAGDDEFVLIFK